MNITLGSKKNIFIGLTVIIIVTLITVFFSQSKQGYPVDEQTLTKGKILFSTQCQSCHSLTEEGIGPRLGGVTTVLSEKHLLNFINNPAAIIASGDVRANSLQKRYNQVMPSFDLLKDDDVKSILAYIDNESKLTKVEPLKVDTTAGNKSQLSKKYAPDIKKSGLVVQLEDFIKIPRADSNPPDKGIATLRAYPAGDGTLFVSDQMGIIYRIENGKAETFLNVRSAIPDFIFTSGIGTGLGSFAFHPDFLQNGLIYTTHAERFIGKPADFQFADTFKPGLQWVLSEWKIIDIKAHIFKGSRRELLRINTPTTGHGVQDISFVPTTDKKNPDYGMLFLGIGDGGSNNIKRPDLGHNKQSLLGTVIRINPLGKNSKNGQYGIPADNPFAKDPDPATRKEIWAYGFRNPHRMAWDIINNRMLIADIGESNIEEVNVIEKGKDYGWPVREGNYRIATKENLKTIYPLNDSERSVYHAPFAVYDHTEGHAISGGYVYEGKLDALRDKYVFGDIVTGKLFYVNMDGPLSDSSVYDLSIVENNKPTDMLELNNTKRVHLRIGYDVYTKELYIMAKNGMIRKITDAYIKK